MSNTASGESRVLAQANLDRTAWPADPTSVVAATFRQSADGVTFVETEVHLLAADARAAQQAAPHEWAYDHDFAPWPNGYDNTAQSPGGLSRRRCVGSPLA